jgi:predicted nuclease of predicted toxin-antitoxin system
MKFLVDECCSASLVEELRVHGHDVLYVMEDLRGATDREVLQRAFDEGRILLTEDKDFGELVYRLRLPARGIVLLRFDPAATDLKAHRLRLLLQEDAEKLLGSFTVVDPNKVRVRPLG